MLRFGELLVLKVKLKTEVQMTSMGMTDTCIFVIHFLCHILIILSTHLSYDINIKSKHKVLCEQS